MDNTTNCTQPAQPYNSLDYIGVAVASVISAFISFVASGFVIFLILFFKKWQVLVQRLVLYLSIATLLNSIAIMIHRVDYLDINDQNMDNFCVVAGFFEQHAGWMQLDAVVCITVHLFLCAVVNVRLEKLEWIYITIIFFLPLSFNWIPFIKTAYGRAGAWCWIRDMNEDCTPFDLGTVFRFVLWYVPLYIILLILMILYVFILYKLHRTRRHWVGRYDPTTERVKEQTRTEVAPLIWYPVIYFLLNIFPFINRSHNIANPTNPNLGLWYLHAITYPLVGAFVAFPFLLDPETRRNLHWSNFKAAASQLCERDNGIREYPIEQSDVDKVEGKQMMTLGENTSSYNSFEDNRDS